MRKKSLKKVLGLWFVNFSHSDIRKIIALLISAPKLDNNINSGSGTEIWPVWLGLYTVYCNTIQLRNYNEYLSLSLWAIHKFRIELNWKCIVSYRQYSSDQGNRIWTDCSVFPSHIGICLISTVKYEYWITILEFRLFD